MRGTVWPVQQADQDQAHSSSGQRHVRAAGTPSEDEPGEALSGRAAHSLEEWCMYTVASLQWNPPKPSPPQRQRKTKICFLFQMKYYFLLKIQTYFLDLTQIHDIMWTPCACASLCLAGSNRLAVPTDNCGSVCFSHASTADLIPTIKILLH